MKTIFKFFNNLSSLILLLSIHPLQASEPFTHYYKNYQTPPFYVPEIDLTLDVQKDHVAVTTQLEVKRNGPSESLILDGRKHKVHAVSVNGKILPKEEYQVTENELIILNAPQDDHFTVTVQSEIDPYNNTSLEGLYSSGKFLTTQCESEGARKIFFTFGSARRPQPHHHNDYRRPKQVPLPALEWKFNL